MCFASFSRVNWRFCVFLAYTEGHSYSVEIETPVEPVLYDVKHIYFYFYIYKIYSVAFTIKNKLLVENKIILF